MRRILVSAMLSLTLCACGGAPEEETEVGETVDDVAPISDEDGVVSAACTNNVYRVTWDPLGVYEFPSTGSRKLPTKVFKARLTGPTGYGSIDYAGGPWTKVWVNTVPGHREGWVRAAGRVYTGCN